MVKVFGELIDWYCDNMGKLGISPTDQKTKRSAFIAMQPLRKMVLTESYVRSREKLDGMAVREWRISMQERGLANGTICRYLSAGSVVIKTAWREKGWKLPNPFEDQTWGLTQKPRKRILTDMEEAKMLLALPQPYKDIVALILETGLRDGEVLRLDWERVDLDAGWIHFREGCRTGNGGSKSGREEVAALSIKALEIIDRQPRGLYVFLARYDAFIKAWHKARINAGVEHCTPHDLRRTWGVRARAKGIDLDGIQAQLRHRSRSTTERVYAAVQPEKAQEAIRVLNRT